jgi:hypothetical protein
MLGTITDGLVMAGLNGAPSEALSVRERQHRHQQD